jgi:alpha-galactosidase
MTTESSTVPPLASDAGEWLGRALLADDVAELPFSFTYDGRSSRDLLRNWGREVAPPSALDKHRTQHIQTFTDPATGLVLRCEAVAYADFPAVEWTLYFANGGAADSPILADIQAIDARFERGTTGELILHHATGSPALATDYEPRETILKPRTSTRIRTRGGRSSDTDLPYFNIAGADAGVIAAIGWPGQWAASFDRNDTTELLLRAGQELTHFRLHPGEEVRSPLIALVFYRGDWIDGQNVWRRWMLAHNLPRLDGELPPPFLSAASSNQFNEMENANEENQRFFLDRYLDEGIKLDYWWMDAGWYETPTGRWFDTGTWEVDRKRFPNGLRGVTDHAHARGLKIVVWFEPERLAAGTWLAENHPDWLIELPDHRWKLLNLGNPAAWQWVVEHFDALVREQGVDLYRQDFNVAPLDYWRSIDPPDRQGIAEIRHVTGYLAYWDELRRRHPTMLLDTCASGGRRNDLETLRRSVPLHKSDHDYRDHEARQSQAYGIAFWMPFHGAPVCRIDRVDTYAVRSAVGLMLGLGYDVRRTDLDYALLKKLTEEWRSISAYYYGDYYPLTSYSADDRDWLAWQYHRPETGDGLIQAFRRSRSPYVAAQLRLRGLNPDATYLLTDRDSGATTTVSGRALLDEGFPLTLPNASSAAIVTYRTLAND